jgi:2,3-bisphosphoglycerate-independent phosphoglycerate mutase
VIESDASSVSNRVKIQQNDGLIIFNFRGDRARQITTAFVLPDFNKFNRTAYLKDLLVVTMAEYDKSLPVEIAFPPEVIAKPLAKVLSDNGLQQLHIAETEKYAHITYFFNGGREEPFSGEERILVPSPQVVAYDQVPEMSAREIRDRLVREVHSGKYDFLVVNFANADMVAHTGNLKATVEAVEVLDKMLKELTESVLSLDGVALITSDHGNAEGMFDLQTGEINKEHSSSPVPCIIVGRNFTREKSKVPELVTYIPKGVLADVAPTILKIINLKIPAEMTGRPLI